MALVAQCIDLRHIQQPGVLRAMRRMAAHASFCLDRGMLVDKGSARLRVALGADHVLIGRRLQIVVPESAVNVMAVAALHQAFVHAVVKRHIEGRLNLGVALKAEHGLSSLQQFFLIVATVNTVAAHATYARLGMRRTLEVGVRSRVAAQACLINLRKCGLGRIEDFGDVARAFNVSLARAVARLAGDPGLAVLKGQLAVRIVDELFGLGLVACGADFGSDIIRRIRVLDLRSRRLRCIGLGGGLSQSRGADQNCAQEQH